MTGSGPGPILRVLEIPVSTFHGWVARQRRPSPYQIEETWLGEQIQRIHTESGRTYGSPRIHAQLRREGIRVSRKRVERLMRCQACRARSCASGATAAPAATQGHAGTGSGQSGLHRASTQPTVGRRHLAGPHLGGPLWLASVRDAFSRRVVGWKTSDRADTQLVLGALDYALCSRQLEPDRLVFHSDHGAQYTAVRFTQRLADAGIAASMGSVGDSLDNALAENLFSIVKVERVHRTSYRTREEAELDLLRFIDGWYNPRRIQRRLGWLSPDEYEEAYYRSESAGTLASPTGAR